MESDLEVQSVSFPLRLPGMQRTRPVYLRLYTQADREHADRKVTQGLCSQPLGVGWSQV